MMYNMISIYSHDIILFIIYIRIDTSYYNNLHTYYVLLLCWYGGAAVLC